MTREEQINKEAYRQEGLVDMDVDSFIAGAKWADKTMIEKACEWLLKGGYFVNNTETINDFKQAMDK